MKPIARLFAIAPAVVLFMAVTPSWGEPPDPTDSEAPRHIAGNTACGGVALNRAGFSTAIDNALSRNNLKPNADRHERQVLRAPPPNVSLYEAGWPCQVATRSLPLNLKSVSFTVAGR
jgi:hypothetical protein